MKIYRFGNRQVIARDRNMLGRRTQLYVMDELYCNYIQLREGNPKILYEFFLNSATSDFHFKNDNRWMCSIHILDYFLEV